jgi:hypothetical protein
MRALLFSKYASMAYIFLSLLLISCEKIEHPSCEDERKGKYVNNPETNVEPHPQIRSILFGQCDTLSSPVVDIQSLKLDSIKELSTGYKLKLIDVPLRNTDTMRKYISSEVCAIDKFSANFYGARNERTNNTTALQKDTLILFISYKGQQLPPDTVVQVYQFSYFKCPNSTLNQLEGAYWRSIRNNEFVDTIPHPRGLHSALINYTIKL